MIYEGCQKGLETFSYLIYEYQILWRVNLQPFILSSRGSFTNNVFLLVELIISSFSRTIRRARKYKSHCKEFYTIVGIFNQ